MGSWEGHFARIAHKYRARIEIRALVRDGAQRLPLEDGITLSSGAFGLTNYVRYTHIGRATADRWQ